MLRTVDTLLKLPLGLRHVRWPLLFSHALAVVQPHYKPRQHDAALIIQHFKALV